MTIRKFKHGLAKVLPYLLATIPWILMYRSGGWFEVCFAFGGLLLMGVAIILFVLFIHWLKK